VFSDVPGDLQLRWIEDDNRVTEFRKPSGNSNGNTFDYQGRQISCQHGHRRVLRYEHDGSTTILASNYNGKRFNSPNDVIVNKNDNSIWFTDPSYGIMKNYTGRKAPSELKEAVYRIDSKTAKITKVTDDITKPNGLCFSPDLKTLYVSDTGDGENNIKMWDIDGETLKNRKQFTSMKMDSFDKVGHADGIRADEDGNIWSSAGWVGEGYDGVHIFAPNGDRIGQILLPENCANLCFGGRKRNRLFMAASQSLYAVYTDAIGAHIT
jgi:gluconolactonase